MRFTWKGPTTISAYPSNTAPNLSANGPYPREGKPNVPTTVTKTVLKTIPRGSSAGSAYYDPLNKTVLFETATCTSIGTSLPAVCNKKWSRPLKIWRKRLQPGVGKVSSHVTISQLEGTSVIVTKNAESCIHTDIAPFETCCQKIKIRRSGGFNPGYCTSTREYLQRRCKTYDQNQSQGKKIQDKPYMFTSGQGYEPSPTIVVSDAGETLIPKVTGVCNQITIHPSNSRFHTQGGVSASSRTNLVKYETVMSNVALKNYATARATMDTGYVNIKGQNPSPKEWIHVRQDRAHVECCNK